MELDFFDANVYVGQPTNRALFCPFLDGPELIGHMDQAGIRRALVWHIAQFDDSPVLGNDLLIDAISGNERLKGCWALLPPQTGEVVTPDFFDRMKEARIVALRACPDAHRYLLNRVVFGAFLDEVAERRIPLLLSLQHGVTWPVVYQLLQEFPTLTCVLCDIGTWSQDRYTYPLLENFERVFVETSLLALEDGGVEGVVDRYGADRLVFGTGLPERYAESATLQLTHADMAESDKQAIAGANLEGLLGEVRL